MMDIAMLSDQAPNDEGGFDEPIERAFVYVRPADWVTRDDDLRDVFAGSGDPGRAIEQWNQDFMRMRGGDPLGEGTVVIDDREIPYAVQRGGLNIDGNNLEGILAVIVVKCEGKRDGLGGWLVPDSADLAGTPADPETLTAFLGQFELCG